MYPNSLRNIEHAMPAELRSCVRVEADVLGSPFLIIGLCSVHCCFTSTETTRIIRDGEPRTVTSTFAQLLSSRRSLRT